MNYKIDTDFNKNYEFSENKDDNIHNTFVENQKISNPNKMILAIFIVIFLISIIFPVKTFILTSKLNKVNKQYSNIVNESRLMTLKALYQENQELSAVLEQWNENLLPPKGACLQYTMISNLTEQHKGHIVEFSYKKDNGIDSKIYFMTTIAVDVLRKELEDISLYISEINYQPNYIEVHIQGDTIEEQKLNI